ncbi:MAG: NAD(P)-binding protein [bacterium]|jgi:flavin-dependent dehydrogenase
MGAGLSGLSCALTLEKHGIAPIVFESRNQVGDRFVNGEILLSILSRPVTDSIAYFANDHSIFLQPASNIKKMFLYSAKEEALIEGNLGFVTVRGRDYDSLENQLVRQYKGEIIFNSKYSYEQLLQDFTHVVVATGDAAYADKIQIFNTDLTVTLRGATVEGLFQRSTVMAWLNNFFAPQGYCYLIPFSEREANIVIAYPDYPENRKYDINILWDSFFQDVCMRLNQNLRVTDRFEITHYMIGTCRFPRIGNTFFTGNCFGSVMPFLGFGQFAAILTGIYAAHDLCGKGDYAQLTKSLQQSYKNSLVLRRIMESLNNQQFDTVVRYLNSSLGQKLFNSTRLDVMKVASYLLRPMAGFKKN